MLKVTVEIIPNGQADKTRLIGTLQIGLREVRQGDVGQYSSIMSTDGKYPPPNPAVTIDHHQRDQGAFALIQQCLDTHLRPAWATDVLGDDVAELPVETEEYAGETCGACGNTEDLMGSSMIMATQITMTVYRSCGVSVALALAAGLERYFLRENPNRSLGVNNHKKGREKMPQYRKKPIVIEAVQYFDRMRQDDQLPDGVVIIPWPDAGDVPAIHTLEGDYRVMDGDWIITGIEGEKYPCKPGIFEKTYEAC